MMILFIVIHFLLLVCAQELRSELKLNVDGVGALNLFPERLHNHTEPSSPRHVKEKLRLLNALKHESAEWGPNHPRYKLLQALHGLYRYKDGCLTDLDLWKKAYDGISSMQKELISSVTAHEKRFALFRENQISNQDVIQRVLANAMEFYEISIEELELFVSEEEGVGALVNPYRVSDILNHLVRDWSIGGPHKRELGSEPILDSLSILFPDRRAANEVSKRILVPGAGMGRLAHEIAQLGGFEVTMNEISADMNVFYRYVERLQYPESDKLYPFIDWWSYQPSIEELGKVIRVPDVAVNSSDVLLVEGDFMSVFQNSSSHFDAVVTLFFIDTAQNMLDYMDTIKHILKPGGLWINLGSFLYGASPFLHLSLEDFASITKKMGFRFVDTDEKWGPLSLPSEKIRTRDVSYLFNERAYRKKLYEAHFWIVEKISSPMRE